MTVSMIGSNSSSTSLNMETDSITSKGKRCLKEGPIQMTSLSTLLSFHRYFFLYHDTLIVSKQKGGSSYKLKEKLRLSNVWVASSNTADSFLVGWPLNNYLVHFRNREEKEEWFELLSYCVQQSLKPLFSTISMDINVRGRKQVIRKRIDNGKKSGELVVETATELGLPNTSYELKLVVGDSSSKTLQGPENVYAVIMHELDRSGMRLSESQRQSLDTCPIANTRLVLSNMKANKTPSPMHIVNSIKKRVLHRSESRGVLGRELEGGSPPQTIMTIVDHLRMKGTGTEGIFRKSPKQSTFKELRQELERGIVPDYNKYSTHVLASMLKEYLRSIPGKILQSGNYELWMKEVVDETDMERKIVSARNLVCLLPSSHCILLSNVLRLLSLISASSSSKMTSSALSVCLGPSFIEPTEQLEGGKKIPLLVQFLIENAASIVPGFQADNIFSIEAPLDVNSNLVVYSPSCSSEGGSSQRTPIIEEMDNEDDSLSQCSIGEIMTSSRSEWAGRVEREHRDIEGPLCFSSDEEEEEGARERERIETQRGRGDSFRSATLQSIRSQESTLGRKENKDDKSIPLKAEERKEPRSPCLKRIHFQRTEAQKMRSQAFKFESRAEFEFDRKREDSVISPSPSMDPPRRKESKEEATQTEVDERVQEAEREQTQRFPPFRSSSGDIEKVAEVSPSPRVVRKEPVPFEAHVASKMRDDTVRPIRNEEKPTVQVHPFNQEPSLQTITERLAMLRERTNEERPDSPRYACGVSSVPPPQWNSRSRQISHDWETKDHDLIIQSPNLARCQRVAPPRLDDCQEEQKEAASRLLAPFHNGSRTESAAPPVLITERFPPYCIEPNEYVPYKKAEIHRTSSQRGEKSPATIQRELQRAASVKVPSVSRRDLRVGVDSACVGMDPLEINWSVRHLKSLFQDKRAPAIDTDYNCPY